MEEINISISGLLYKYLSGGLSEAENEELQLWLDSNETNKEILNRLENESEFKKDFIQLFEFNNEEGWSNILKKSGNQVVPVKREAGVILLKRIAVAAAIVSVLFSSIYLFNNKKEPSKFVVIKKEQKNHQQPGQNGAILILNNGQQLLLDSTANGVVSEQNNISLTKKDGQLIYNGDGSNSTLAYNTMITPRGRQFSLVLSDGTKVWLNSASSIKFPVVFAADERRVEITGEVYFEVAHALLPNNKTLKPFIVQVHSANLEKAPQIEVLGTHFNVNGYDDEEIVSTTLLTGKIKMSGNESDVQLLPGQQAVLNTNNKSSISINKYVDTSQVMSWKRGRFEFDNIELPAIMRQISRWYDVEIVYKKQPDHEKYFGGISKSVPLANVLKMLEANDVKFKIDGNKIFVNP